MAAHASLPDRSENQLRLDVMVAALRSRFDAQRIPKGASVYVYVDKGLGAGLEGRLRDYKILVRSGSVGPKPPKRHWYWIHLGKITENEATILIEDGQTRLRDLHLRKKAGQWLVVAEEAPLLH